MIVRDFNKQIMDISEADIRVYEETDKNFIVAGYLNSLPDKILNRQVKTWVISKDSKNNKVSKITVLVSAVK